MLLMNAHHEEVPFSLPTAASGMRWVAIADTSCQTATVTSLAFEGSTTYPLQARSLAVLVERPLDQIRQNRRDET